MVLATIALWSWRDRSVAGSPAANLAVFAVGLRAVMERQENEKVVRHTALQMFARLIIFRFSGPGS